MNICMIGHGMMAVWHSEALGRQPHCVLHTVVGRRPEPTREFAARFGYRHAVTELAAALDDPAVDIVIIASPSETHAEMALASLAHGKHTLVEAPIAMTLADGERVVDAAHGRGLTLGVVHPMGFRRERGPLIERIRRGDETVRSTHGRFFMQRVQNVDATGDTQRRADNILWHHGMHLVDFGLWMLNGGDMSKARNSVRKVECFMPALDALTGIPMEIALTAQTHDDQSIVVTGSYDGRARLHDTLVVTDRNAYRLDELRSTLTTGETEQPIATERGNAWLAARDFVGAVRAGREPLVPGWSVLPSLRLVHAAQAIWDARHGRQAITGRPTP